MNMNGQGAPAEESPIQEYGTLTPQQLLRLARGFSRIFWGIPVSLLLFLDVLDIRLVHPVRLPTYVIGVLLVYWGFTAFQRAAPVDRRWATLLRWGFFLLFMQIYFAPFVHWWRRYPASDYHLYNVIALLCCMMVTLLIINRLSGIVADRLGDRTFRLESNLCGFSVVMLMIVPLSTLVSYSIWGVIRFDTSFYVELLHTHQQLTRWMNALFLLPLTLTMLIAWKAKERCLQALRMLAAMSIPALESNGEAG